MPEVIVKYKKAETLKILKGLAKQHDFELVDDRPKATLALNDIFIAGDRTLDIAELEDVFTDSGLDAKKLRKDLWKRPK